MATPSKLTPEVEEKFFLALRGGNYIETAAVFAGVTRDAVYKWLKKAREAPRSSYGRFAERVHEALAAAEVHDLALIGEAAKTVWTAAAWRFERRYPDKWGKRERIEQSGALKIVVEFTDNWGAQDAEGSVAEGSPGASGDTLAIEAA